MPSRNAEPMLYTFCPRCGARLQPRPTDGRELRACPSCTFTDYQNSLPCVGVLALDRGRVLLVKRAIEPFKGYWDIPGGFLESGEHPADGAIREMLEETNLRVDPTEVIGFFMDIYGADQEPTLNICYLAQVCGGEQQAGSDAERIGWFPLDDLPRDIAFTWEREALDLLARRLRAAPGRGESA